MVAKRIMDLVLVIPGLLILLPVLALVSLWIKFDSTGPVIFKQKRIGMDGVSFLILKFRTMVVDSEKLGAKVTVENDSRITKSGGFLRKYKLDELPQLINVLKGDMSLVGPRPEVSEYVAYWPADLRKIILSVPPGITDFSSIEFRNESELLKDETETDKIYINDILPIKLKYYVKYVNERSLWMDIVLIARTIRAIFLAR